MKTFDAFNFAARLTQQSQQKKIGKTTKKGEIFAATEQRWRKTTEIILGC